MLALLKRSRHTPLREQVKDRRVGVEHERNQSRSPYPQRLPSERSKILSYAPSQLVKCFHNTTILQQTAGGFCTFVCEFMSPRGPVTYSSQVTSNQFMPWNVSLPCALAILQTKSWDTKFWMLVNQRCSLGGWDNRQMQVL